MLSPTELMLKKFGGIVKDMCQKESLIRFHRDDLWWLGHGMRRASAGQDIGPEARAAIQQLRVEAHDEVVALTLAVERVWFLNNDDNDPARYLPDGRRNWAEFPIGSPSRDEDSWLRIRPSGLAYPQASCIGETPMIVPAVLAGRCANGREADQGRIVHAVECKPDDLRFGIPAYTRSLCGKTHGARSAGWSDRRDLTVNCQKCLKAIAHCSPETETGKKSFEAWADLVLRNNAAPLTGHDKERLDILSNEVAAAILASVKPEPAKLMGDKERFIAANTLVDSVRSLYPPLHRSEISDLFVLLYNSPDPAKTFALIRKVGSQ